MTADELYALANSNYEPHGFEQMLQFCKTEGMIIEFGVASGRTINEIAENTTAKVYGFDSFEGLPEDWRPSIGKGSFKCEIPVVKDNVVLVVGLIEDTIDGFLKANKGPVSFIHIDTDIYSSAACILQKLKKRIRSGTVIAFDEFMDYHGYEDHEFKAFLEFINDTGFEVELLGRRQGEARTFRIK
jgi:hypothetical protein